MKLKVINSQTLSEFEELDLSLAIRMEGEYLIGRSPNSGLVLDSPDVSRQHGKFLLQNGNYYYCDVGSRNGSLVNGKIVEANQKYVLKPGDVIRLGEFALMLEEITFPYLEETVVRVIDATVVSNSLGNQQIPPQPKQEEKVPEVAAQEVPNLITANSQQIGQFTTEEQAPEVVDPQAVPVSEELTYIQIDEYPTFIQQAQVANEIPENAIATPQLETEVIVVIDDRREQITPDSQPPIPPTSEEPSVEVVDQRAAPTHEASTDVHLYEHTSIQPPEENDVTENAIATPQLETEVVVVIDDQREQITPDSQPLSPPTSEEPSVEVVDQRAAPTHEASTDVHLYEHTSIQPPEENDVTENAIATPQLETEVVVVIDDQREQITPDSQPLSPPTSEEPSVEVVDQRAAPTHEASTDVHLYEHTSIQPPEENDVTENAIATPQLETEVVVVIDDQREQITPDSQPLSPPTSEEPSVKVVDQRTALTHEASTDVHRDEFTSIQPPEENDVTENAIAIPQLETEVIVVVNDLTEQITPDSQQIEQPAIEEESREAVVQSSDVAEDVILSETPEFIDKYIVLIAHDSKKSELAEIVAQHQKFFSKCLTLASSSISDLVAQKSGITISQQTTASGGYQSIASIVSSGDVLAVIFLRDLLMPQPGQANEEALLRLCNINNLLVATNSSTVEAIMHYLESVYR